MSEFRACALSDLTDGAALRVEFGGCPVALVRMDGTVHAIGDTCSHAEVSLAEGFVDTDECALECWKHGSLFSLETGEALTLPASRPVPVYAVRIEGADVYVEIPGEEGQ